MTVPNEEPTVPEDDPDEVDAARAADPEPDPDIPTAYITPRTRRLIIASLAAIALVAIIAEVLIVLLGKSSSEALLTVAATAVGALGGIALPGSD